MFDTLSDKLQGALGDLRGRGVLTEEDLSRAARILAGLGFAVPSATGAVFGYAPV